MRPACSLPSVKCEGFPFALSPHITSISDACQFYILTFVWIHPTILISFLLCPHDHLKQKGVFLPRPGICILNRELPVSEVYLVQCPEPGLRNGARQTQVVPDFIDARALTRLKYWRQDYRRRLSKAGAHSLLFLTPAATQPAGGVEGHCFHPPKFFCSCATWTKGWWDSRPGLPARVMNCSVPETEDTACTAQLPQ